MADSSLTPLQEDEVEVDPNDVSPVPAHEGSQIARVVVHLRRLFGCKENKPLPRLQPRIVTSFLYLGKKSILGRNAEIDDRLHVFRDGMKLISERGSNDLSAMKIKKSAVTLLHNKRLPQPQPTSYLAPRANSATRRHPYARRVEKRNPSDTLPDLSRIFDTLMQATNRSEHPNGISSLTFAFAEVISLSLVRTSPSNSSYNETSPYLDLSPLYGSNEDEESQVRVKDGRGMLSPDCFFDNRVIFSPPAVSVLLILWNRSHNDIARRLLLHNEGGKWVTPSNGDDSDDDSDCSDQFAAQDDEIFSIARRINCALFRDVVREDFLKGLLELANVGPSAKLDILADGLIYEDGDRVAKGEGHIASVECSLLYNWPAMASREDMECTDRAMKDAFGDISFQTITPADFNKVVETAKVATHGDRKRRNCAGLRRDGDRRFDDEDLARILHNATESTTGAHRALGTSPSKRVMELIVMKQARDWNVCSLNDFRRFLGLKPFTTFKEWNSDPKIFTAAEALYGDVDNLELYPGLQTEEAIPGSGFCLGYTMTYGLLVDLVTLIRSDPSFTTDFTSEKLTKWGLDEFRPQPDDGAFGAMLPKLLFRTLPRHYSYNSVYALFPFTSPSTTSKILASMNLSSQYDTEKPLIRKTKVTNPTAIRHVLNNPAVYRTSYGHNLKLLTGGYGYFLGFDNEKLHDADQMMTLCALIPDPGALPRYAAYYRRITERLIKTKSKVVSGTSGVSSIDVVGSVINIACTRWVCETISGLPPTGKENETQMFNKLAALHAFAFQNIEPANAWAIRSAALDASRDLSKRIGDQVLSKQTTEGFVNAAVRIFLEWWKGLPVERTSAHTFLDMLRKSSEILGIEDLEDDELKKWRSDKGEEESKRLRLVANVLGLSVFASVRYAQACAHAVDFYLDDKRTDERAEIVRLSERNDPKDNPKIMGYIREALRMDHSAALFRDVAEDATIPQGDNLPPLVVRKGDRIVVDMKSANMNPVDFASPDSIDWTRKMPYTQGMGFHKCPAIGFADKTMPEMFKAIFRLKNLRCVPGGKGRLVTFHAHAKPLDTDPKTYLDENGKVTFFPSSLVLQYDESNAPIKPPGWTVPKEHATRWRKIMDRILIALVAVIVLWLLISYFISRWSLPSSPRTPSPPRKRPVLQIQDLECKPPTTAFQPWEINAILPGPDDKPLPIEYTLENKKPHRISVIDIDARDMELELYVDGVLRGLTGEFDLNKTVTCGDDLRTCLDQGFSAGVVVVASGKHTVKLAWAGKEFIPDTGDIDWGNERTRRFKWMREYCS